MKKKRVSKAISKKTAKRSPAARSKGVVTTRAPKISSQVSSSRKAAKVKTAERSTRITSALKKVPKISSSKRKKISEAELEPLSFAVPMPVEMITDLPFSYNETKLVLMVRDPIWAFTYWDFSAETWNWIVAFRERDRGAKPKLRVHNLDNGTSYDRDIYLDAKNWYLELGLPDTTFELELGILDSQGNFHRIALSNRMKTPRRDPSQKIDAEWELSEFESSEIYRLSGGGRTGHGSEIFSSIKRPK